MNRYSVITLTALIFSLQVVAQPLVSKHGEPILPQKKDWGIGLDATALVKDIRWNYAATSQALIGKYFIDSATAYRAGVRLGFTSYTTGNRVLDRLSAQTNTVIAFPAPVATKVNTWTRNEFLIGISAGVEKRRGRTRLQGVYGVEGNIFLSFLRDQFSYGNQLIASNSTPVNVTGDDAMTSAQFGNANNIDTTGSIIQGATGFARVVERSRGLAFSMGVRGFAGAEYFVLPKISIGGEFGWGLGFLIMGRSETVYESVGQSSTPGATGKSVKSTTLDGTNTALFYADSDNGAIFGGPTASLRILLYF